MVAASIGAAPLALGNAAPLARPAPVIVPPPAAVLLEDELEEANQPGPPDVFADVAMPIEVEDDPWYSDAIPRLITDVESNRTAPTPAPTFQLTDAERAFFDAGDDFEADTEVEDFTDLDPVERRGGFWSRLKGKQAS
ncbi:MAG TPA: hypothetical protein VKZ63_13190 [Kofleriaceae bacterium]|nr:hypothetical protein [Kofleriaceae bacterium]